MQVLIAIVLGVGLAASPQPAAAAPQATPPPTPPGIVTPSPQTPPPAVPAQTPTPGRKPGFPVTWKDAPATFRNIKLNITFADTVGPDGPAKKTLTLLVMNNKSGQIRSTGREGGIINIDALPGDLNDGRVSVFLTIEYLPELSAQQVQSGVRLGMLSQSLSVVLDSGKPTIVTESADPRSDRKVTVEVTATVVK
jgi:hypothetical protein